MSGKYRVLIGLGVLLAILATAWPAAAQTAEKLDPVVESLDARVKQFLEDVSLGNTQAAYKQLLAGGLLAKQTDAVDALVQKTNKLKAEYGEYRSFERVWVRRVGEDIIVLAYVYKCENFPVAWRVTFYRPPSRPDAASEVTGRWRVIAVRFDTDVESLAN